MAYQGAPNYVDIARMHEPGFWGPQPNTQKDTYNNLYALSQAESISTGSAQGYAQKIAEYLGMGPNEFQDYSLGAFQRGILMGQKDDPLAPVEFGASQLTPEVQDNLRSILSKLLPIAKQEPQDPENPTPTQKRVNAMMYQLAYAKASEVTKTDLGFSVVDAFRSQAEVYGKILNAYTYGAAGALYDGYNAAYNPTKNTKIARGIDDILKIRNRVDLTFDPAMWWRNLDPTVQQGFIENGISPSTIRTALNEDEANFRIGEIIFKGDTQKRIEAYAPGYLDSGRLIRDNLIGGIINSSDTVPFIALELGATVLTGGVGSLVATAAAAPTTGLTVFRAARNVASTIAKLPLGISPTYAKNLGLIGGSTLTGAIFGVGAALQETTRQEKQIAYANALVFADPEMQKDYDLSSIGWAGGEGFAIGFLGFGVLPQVVGSTAGAFLNKLKGVNVAPLGESVVRMTGDKRFTYEGTSVGEALGFYKGKLSRKDVAVDLPLHEKIITEAELEGVKPSAQTLSNETQTAVNRADARAAVTPDAARATPDVPMTRRLDNETRQAYAERTGANGTLSNIIEFVTEVSRKNSAGDAVKERASLTGTGDTFGDMGTTDRLRILYASEEHLNTTRLKEKEAGKLTPAREKAYAIMESQRRSMIKQYTKSLSKPERKALSDSLGGVKKSVKTITEHVADARSTVITSAAKNDAAEKAAVSLLGTAREIVANPARKAELSAAIPENVSEILDSLVTELAITNTVSESTVDAIKADISGTARKPSNKLTSNIQEALKIKKLNPKRTALINALKEDLSKFSSLVSGNKDNADRFYQFTNDLVDGGYINAIDQSILLASVVHLNFDSKVFGLKFEIDSIVNKKTGKIEYTTVGAFNDVTKAITINSSWIGNSSERRVMTVLHEIGHAYFQSSATSDIYLDTLKMYNSLTRNYGPSLLNLNVAKITDPLLSSGYLTEYHLQNMEEVFVHTFSQVLFSEAQLAVAQMAPLEVSSFRSILNDMKKGIILAASMFDSSDHYAVANNLITRITEIDMVASRAISVPDLAEAMAQAAKNKTDNFTYDSFNSVVRDWMIKNKPNYAQSVVEKAKLTKDEFKLLFEIRQDPSLIVAMAILKSNGRQAIDAQGNLTIHMPELINAYSTYKQTQFGSMLIKTAWLLTTQEYKQMGSMNKRRRLGFIQEKLFDIEVKEFKQGSYATPMLPATYEDRHLALVESTNYLDPSKNPILYAFNFWGTRADSLIAMLNNPNKLNETIANKKNILSETDRLALIDKAMKDPYLNQPLIRTLQEYYKNNGFEDIAHLVTLAHHKHYIETLKTEGVFDADIRKDVDYDTPDVLIGTVKDTLNNLLDPATKTAVTEADKDVAAVLLEVLDDTTLAKQVFKSTQLADNVGGKFFSRKNTIGLNTRFDRGNINIHEIIHAGVWNKIDAILEAQKINTNRPLDINDFRWDQELAAKLATTNPESTIYKESVALYQLIKAYRDADDHVSRLNIDKTTIEGRRLVYGLTNLNEFIAEFLANEKFRNLFVDLKTSNTSDSPAAYVGEFSRLVWSSLKRILGMDIENTGQTAFIQKSLKNIETILRADIKSKSDLTPRVEIDSMRRDMDLPIWSSKEVAIDSIAAFLSNKEITHLSIPTLLKNIDPVLIQKLSDTPNMTPETALAGIHKMIETGAIVLNETSGKWEMPTAKPKRKKVATPLPAETPVAKAKKAEIKAEAKLAALADNSEELTIDNLEAIIIQLINNKAITADIGGVLYLNLDYVKQRIESGTTKTISHLIGLGKTIGKNKEKDFIKAEQKAAGLETKEGITKEGVQPRVNAGVFQPTTAKENRATLFETALTWNDFTSNNLLTAEEIRLAKALLTVESDKELASKSVDLLGKKIGERTIGTRRDELTEKIIAIGKAIEYDPKDKPADIQDALLFHLKQTEQTVSKAVEKPQPVKKIVKQAEDTPAPKPVSTPVDAGSRLLENQALAAKLKKKDPAPVMIPVTKVEEGTLFRATSEVTGNVPEAVLRPEKQVDAIIENSDVSTKEAVSFVPKKPLTMTMTAAEFMANEVKMASTMKVADRMGVDALVFSDGVVMPIQADAPVVVKGVTETKVKAGVPSVTKIKVKKGVPVQTVTAVVEPPKVEVVEPTTTPAPAVAPVEDLPSTPVPPAANDGAPVRVTKTGGIAPPAPRKTVSEVVKTTETERIERVVNDDKDLLRDNGMDQGFLKLFLKNYWTRMQNIDKATDTYSPTLLSLWTKFVTINKAIVEANRTVFGDEGISKFWIAVDKLRAENVQKLATVPGFKSLSERQLMVLAAKEVGDAYMPPILLDELNIVKSSEDATAFTLVAKESKTPRKKVSDATKAESPVPVPPEPTPAPAPKAGDEVGVPEKLDLPIEPIKETPRGDMGRMIDAGVSNSAEGASVLLRQGSLIGAIFGGSERSSRNWWRAMMSWMANSSQAASQTGKTIRNLQRDIRFLSRWFEDNRAQSGHLVGAGKEAFRTARQCKSDEARMITRIARQQLLLNKKLKDSGLALDKVRAVGVLSYTKLSEGTIIAPADLVALGLSPDLAKSIAVEANSLLQITRQTNQTILGLQNETGLFNSNAADGTPFDPMKYAPVQLNHESFSAMSPTDRALFVAGLVKARRTRKLKSPILDINTLIVLGWLDVAPSKEARGTDLFAGKRDFRPGESTQSFSPETLKGLFVSEHPITVGEKGVLAKLANGAESQKHFVLTDPKSGIIRLYRMPTVISELADADRVRYIEAVNGNKSLYTQRWQDYLKGRELIEVEMNEMLDYKTKKGAYSEYQRNTGTNIDRPLMVVDQAAETALAVPGLIPEEVLSDPVILKHIRTNLAESYNYFMNGRVFELIFQRELDRLMGTRNVRITDVFPHIASKSRQNLETIAKAENWTPGQLAARLQDVTEGIQRLKDEYASNADTLPMLPYQDQAAARSLLALMKVKVATGYFLGALPELMMETLKSNPLHLPGNLISALRFVVGDFRVSKNSLMNNSELGDMIFGLENIKYEFSSRFLGEANQGAFELDSTIGSKIKGKFINPRPATGMIDRGVRVLESGARVAETIGSLQAITNITRSMAKVRLQRMIYGHIKKGRIQKLLTALEDPAMMKLMQDYMAAAETSAGAENQLRKQFYTLARKTGFGFNPKEALVFMKYGLNSVEKIKHLEYLIKKVDKKGEGRVNLHNMVDVYWHATTHPVDGIKPEVLEQAISSYGLALEDLVVKTSSPEPIGLGRVTSIDSKTPLGKLWYALSSYIRGFQDNVIMDYGSRDTLRYLAANIVLYGTLDATIGLLREWIAGRDGEDILEEFSDNPHAFAVRVAKSAPIMGMWSGALEAGLSGLSYMSGGTWKYYGSPMQSIGMGAATGAVESIGRGVSEVVEGVTGDEEVDYMKVAKGVGDITSVNSLLNRSPIAVAARSLEVSGALEEKGTLQTYMNMIHKNPHPYAKSQGRKQSSSQSLPPIPKVAPRNFELEAQALKKAREAKAGVRYEDMSKGVSGSLGDLLDNAQ
jgi:Zn-dependent peptidase ImmA (M78 family)